MLDLQNSFTIRQWYDSADLRGYQLPSFTDDEGTVVGDIDPRTATGTNAGTPYTEKDSLRAKVRGTDYIGSFYSHFQTQFQADDVESLPSRVRDALLLAISIASSHELETPNFYDVRINPRTETQERKKIGKLEFFQSRSTAGGLVRIENERAYSGTIIDLMKPFLVATHPASNISGGTATDEICPFVIISDSGI